MFLGRIPDKEIVERSGMIDYLKPGKDKQLQQVSSILYYSLYRGCYFQLVIYLASLALPEVKTPPFTRGKRQLEKFEED